MRYEKEQQRTFRHWVSVSDSCIALLYNSGIGLYCRSQWNGCNIFLVGTSQTLFNRFYSACLGFAWYQKLKPKKEIDCECEEDEKLSFWQSKKFLGIVTVFAALMLAFPYYSGIFFPDNNDTQTIIVKETDVTEARLTIEGMTCTGCEHHVNHSLTSKEGVIEVSSSYETGIAKVKFDQSKVSVEELASEVEKETGYKVIDIKLRK